MTTLGRFWYHFYFIPIRTPIRNLWFWWTHHHETPEQRADRIAAWKKRFLELYNKHREHITQIPASREVQEHIEFMDSLRDKVLGKES
jgi:hypothetical protein